LKTSSRGRKFIRGFESLALVAYPDPGTGAKPWTIGYGSTRVWRDGLPWGPVRPGMVIDEATADQWFEWELLEFEEGVERLVTVPISQGMFDALVSFAFNCGLDEDYDAAAEGLGDSTLLRRLNGGDYRGAAREFGKWIRAGGRVLRGLERRRAGERAMFLEDLGIFVAGLPS
jgi:lysozyme